MNQLFGSDPAPRIAMLPSVAGGMGHVSRCAALARALRRLCPAAGVEFVLDTDRLRPFNVEATRKMGFEPRLLPARNRENRDDIVREFLGEADVIVDDVARYLLPLRQVVPQAAWITIAMHPIGDELFMDWPLMAQMEAVIWPYAPFMGIPAELDCVADKVVRTGPFLETDNVPDKAAARATLGLGPGESAVVYAPRGFPFGRDFGHRVLGAAFSAVQTLRRRVHPGLQLILLAVGDSDDLRDVPGLPARLPEWVRVRGVVGPEESLLHAQAASVLIGEGTSTMHEGAALRTPLVLVPGPIQEAMRLAERLGEEHAAQVFSIDAVSAESFRRAFAVAIESQAAMQPITDRAHALVTGGGGATAAARLVLHTAARQRARLSARRAGHSERRCT